MIETYRSGERLYPLHAETEEEVRAHVARYAYARELIRSGDIVLDAACGAGYGSEMLATYAGRVVGLEVSEQALEYAAENHRRSNVEFHQADLNQPIPWPDRHFDVIVSLETLEHLSNQDCLIGEFYRLLKTDGRLVISSPDRDVSSRAGIPNPFHVAELSKTEFLSLLTQRFEVQTLVGQMRFRPARGWKALLKSIVGRTGTAALLMRQVKRLRLREFVVTRFAERDTARAADFEAVDATTSSEHFILLAVAVKR